MILAIHRLCAHSLRNWRDVRMKFPDLIDGRFCRRMMTAFHFERITMPRALILCAVPIRSISFLPIAGRP
jgi:hypothetical protein